MDKNTEAKHIMMKANYHTHTLRCGHAKGLDEQYIEAAIGRGMEELGFSDHVPWPYENGFSNNKRAFN